MSLKASGAVVIERVTVRQQAGVHAALRPANAHTMNTDCQWGQRNKKLPAATVVLR